MPAEAEASAPNPIDVLVGSRVRLRRQELRISQETLAGHLGLSFQQVQKYEKGFNRVSASVLWKIAQVLECPIAYFFVGAAGGEEGDPNALWSTAVKSDAKGKLMARTIHQLPPAARKLVLELAEELGRAAMEQNVARSATESA